MHGGCLKDVLAKHWWLKFTGLCDSHKISPRHQMGPWLTVSEPLSKTNTNVLFAGYKLFVLKLKLFSVFDIYFGLSSPNKIHNLLLLSVVVRSSDKTWVVSRFPWLQWNYLWYQLTSSHSHFRANWWRGQGDVSQCAEPERRPPKIFGFEIYSGVWCLWHTFLQCHLRELMHCKTPTSF